MITINLEEDIKSLFKKELENFRHEISDSKSYEEICYLHFNLKNRIIMPQARVVEISKELKAKNIFNDSLSVIKRIIELSEKGESIVPYQSRKLVLNAKFNDQLLNDWGLHHLHLSNSLYSKDPYFMDRTKFIIYCYANDEKLLLLDILDHDSFSEPELLKIFVRNWPEITDRYKLNGILAPSDDENLTKKEHIEQARKHGVTNLVSIDGAAYIPFGGGYSTARTSMNVRRETDQFIRHIAGIEEYIIENEDEVKNMLSEALKSKSPNNLNFIIDLGKQGIRVKETGTNLFMQFLQDKIIVTSE